MNLKISKNQNNINVNNISMRKNDKQIISENKNTDENRIQRIYQIQSLNNDIDTEYNNINKDYKLSEIKFKNTKKKH